MKITDHLICDFSCNLSPQLQLNTWPCEFSETFPCFLRGLQHELWQVTLNRISVICFHLLSFYVLTSTEVLKLELSLKILEGPESKTAVSSQLADSSTCQHQLADL